ncbi:hypothetical protein P691DRAFT_412820 [Macrolepiota fuliginosa MF-IS2]|uniref:Nephrocystin 3-like N-terminal domain-containing protein n=1 Tax=Macrolepiota fuliginosa MF-IS2 TaxID=1400762 RepID=A0A9P5X592_9AGAR|nr:hypothetical protein P691DRAFT_412820 [Macrolepiota fuliginosa MF-IS2]
MLPFNLLPPQIDFRKWARDWLEEYLHSRRQSREKTQSSTHSDEPGPVPASLHPEPPKIEEVVSSGEGATDMKYDICPPQIKVGYSEEEACRIQVPTPAPSQATCLPQPEPSPPTFHLESPMIVETVPSGQPVTPLIECDELYHESSGQLSGTTSMSSSVDTWRGAEGRLDTPLVASREGSLSPSCQGHRSQTGYGGALANAHHFSVHEMNIVDVVHMGPNPLEKMLPHVIPGAEFNSAARDPPLKCHPDTHTQIRADLQNRINGTARLIWMHGPVGAGKSAIMQTIAETVPTCATLFFSCSSDPPRNDSKKVLTTLAYSLAVENEDYYKYIEVRLSKDPAFLEKSLADQFLRLFITPFIDNLVKPGCQRWVVLLDGLDECKNDHNDQCRIVELIGDSILRHAGATPFVWVIASRPEAHLMASWHELEGKFRDRPAEL